jgi:hypothetical protein
MKKVSGWHFKSGASASFATLADLKTKDLDPTPPMTEKVILRILHFFTTFESEASGFARPEP